MQLKQQSATQSKSSVIEDKSSNFWHEEDREAFYDEVNGGVKGTRRNEEESSSLPPKSIKS